MQTRLALFYSAASIAGAFSGLLAFALDKMEGIGGLDGWRWVSLFANKQNHQTNSCPDLYYRGPDDGSTRFYLAVRDVGFAGKGRLLLDRRESIFHPSAGAGLQHRRQGWRKIQVEVLAASPDGLEDLSFSRYILGEYNNWVWLYLLAAHGGI